MAGPGIWNGAQYGYTMVDKNVRSTNTIMFYDNHDQFNQNNYRDSFYDFTNFAEAEFTMEIDGVRHKFKHSETPFQAMKFVPGSPEFNNVAASSTPREAFTRGKAAGLRNNWDTVKDEVMYHALLAKFSQNPKLRQKLLGTGNATLVEDAGGNDPYWGNGPDGNGKNMLGRLLMKVRDELSSNPGKIYDTMPSERELLARSTASRTQANAVIAPAAQQHSAPPAHTPPALASAQKNTPPQHSPRIPASVATGTPAKTAVMATGKAAKTIGITSTMKVDNGSLNLYFSDPQAAKDFAKHNGVEFLSGETVNVSPEKIPGLVEKLKRDVPDIAKDPMFDALLQEQGTSSRKKAADFSPVPVDMANRILHDVASIIGKSIQAPKDDTSRLRYVDKPLDGRPEALKVVFQVPEQAENFVKFLADNGILSATNKGQAKQAQYQEPYWSVYLTPDDLEKIGQISKEKGYSNKEIKWDEVSGALHTKMEQAVHQAAEPAPTKPQEAFSIQASYANPNTTGIYAQAGKIGKVLRDVGMSIAKEVNTPENEKVRLRYVSQPDKGDEAVKIMFSSETEAQIFNKSLQDKKIMSFTSPGQAKKVQQEPNGYAVYLTPEDAKKLYGEERWDKMKDELKAKHAKHETVRNVTPDALPNIIASKGNSSHSL